MRRAIAGLAAAGLAFGTLVTVGVPPAWAADAPLLATSGGFTQANLVTDNQAVLTGDANLTNHSLAAHVDPNLHNPWGIAHAPTSPFWVGDNGSGVATLYDGGGAPQALVVTIPASANPGATAPAPVTGVAFNASGTLFNVAGSGTAAHFIFATEDGTIAGWNSGTNAVLKVDNNNFTTGNVYKGLAIGTSGANTLLYATNFRTGHVDVFDSTFAPTTVTGGFVDPGLPAGYAPFGITNIGNQLYVSYALQDAAKHDDVAGAGNGFVDLFNTDGTLVHRFASNGVLNAPWGMVQAPAGSGVFAGDILVGNFGDGHINAFDPNTFNFRGALTDSTTHTPVKIDGLWGLQFGNGPFGNPTTLYFTAGINGEADGLFGSLTPVSPPVIFATEGSPFDGIVTSFTDTDPAPVTADFSATINWGDGTTTPASAIAANASPHGFDVVGTHTFEDGSWTATITITDSGGGGTSLVTQTGFSVADAPLGAAPPTSFVGVGGTNTAGGATTALSAFQTAIGGINNGGNPPEQTTGFRTINWDGVTLDGTDFGGNTTVITANHTVGIPHNRFQTRGVDLGANVAVSGPASPTDPQTFKDVNPSLAGQFPAFSPTQTFAPFNSNQVTITFETPSASSTAPVQQATRGFGAIFRNVADANTTSIEYFSGTTPLGTFFAPVGTFGQAEFLGELFSRPIVTKVVVTLGTNAIFQFANGHATSGPADSPPTTNLVALDDLAYAEPSPGPAIAAHAGIPFSGAVASFTDQNPNASVSDFTATINWGDGAASAGTVATNGSGGFNINGTHTYAHGGTFAGTAQVVDVGGSSLTQLFSANVIVSPSISKAFGAPSIVVGGSTQLTFTITNPNTATALSGLAFTDNFPAGLVVATPNGLTNTCGGTATAVAGGTQVALSGGTLAANTHCTVVVNVTGTFTGTKVNTTSSVTSTNGGTGNTATATIVVNAPPTIPATEGTALTNVQVGHFTTTNSAAVAGNFTATIHWGDGTSSPGTVTGNTGGPFTVTGSHTYADEGSFPVSVTVTPSVPGTINGTLNATAAVAEGDSLTGTGLGARTSPGTPLSNFTTAMFDDTFTGAAPSDFHATINWGDGTPTTAATVTGGGTSGFAVAGNHTYSATGTFTITTTMTDDAPGTATETVTSTAQIASDQH